MLQKGIGTGDQISRIELTEDQSKMVSEAAGRKIRALNLRELQADEIKAFTPGLVRGTIVVCCW